MTHNVRIALFLLLLTVVGCADVSDAAHHEAADIASASAATPADTPTPPAATIEWIPPTRTAIPAPGAPMPKIRYSVEDNIRMLRALVARVRLIEVEELILEVKRELYWQPTDLTDDTIYVAYLRYNFEVLEYLRGGEGESKVWAMASLEHGAQSSEAEARSVFAYYAQRRDTSWDDSEAIVVLGEGNAAYPDNHYRIRGINAALIEAYSLAEAGGWYPLASGGAAGSGGEKRFLVKDPEDYGGVSAASELPWATMSLSDIRYLASLSDEELDKRAEARAKGNVSERIVAQELTATGKEKSVVLRWEGADSRMHADAYTILRRDEGVSDFVEIGQIPTVEGGDGVYEYEDTSTVEAGFEYTYMVRAVISAFFNWRHAGTDAQVSFTAPAATPTLTPTPAP